MKTKLLLTIMLSLSVLIAFAQTDRFEGRPTTPGSDVESFKENLPVKKETFVAKLDRFKKEGFKVAVVLSSSEYTTKLQPPSSTTSMTTQLTLKGTLPSIEAGNLLESFTAKMNETFGTDIFEAVDKTKIPYKESKWGKVDDWEVTKYRMVATLLISPVYDYNITSSKYSGELQVSLSAPIVEYVNEKKGIKMKYPVRGGSLGFYKSAKYESDNNPNIENIEELQALVNPPSGDELVSKIKEEYEANIEKYIEKITK